MTDKNLEKSKITIIKGVYGINILYLLCISSIANGKDALFIDCSNLFDPYIISRMAKYLGIDQTKVLQHLHVARAFTEYQIEALVLDLDKIIKQKNPEILAISNLSSFYNSDLYIDQIYQNHLKLIEKIRTITISSGIITVISSSISSYYDKLIESKSDKICNAEDFNLSNIMGRTVPSFRYHLEEIISELQIFRRALHGEDKVAFDALMDKARKHASSCTIVPTLDPINCILLSILIEQQKEIISLKEKT